MPFTAESDLDLLTVTLRDLGRLKWSDIVSPRQRHIILGQLLKKEKVGFRSGTGLQWNVQTNPQGSFHPTGIGAVDQVNIKDLMNLANIPWRHFNWNWGIDGREISMNKEPARIVELAHARRAGAAISAADGLETQGWNLPGGASDNLNMFGIPYWIVPNATQGFNGGNPFGYTAGAGNLSSVTFPNWANYTDSYSDPTYLDLVRKMRRAFAFCDFQSPTNADIPSYNTGDHYGIYTTYLIRQRMEEVATFQNDNLGADVAKYDNQATFMRTPFTWVPQLDALSGLGMSGTFSNSTYASSGGYAVNPVFMINWGEAQFVFLEGWYMKEYGPYIVPNQHTVMATQTDLTLNLRFTNRRRQAVLTQ